MRTIIFILETADTTNINTIKINNLLTYYLITQSYDMTGLHLKL